MTLADILSRLPRVLSSRYNGEWWTKTAEMVLRIMGSNDLPYETYDHYLYLEDEVFDYEIPKFVERVISAHFVNPTNKPIAYDLLPNIKFRQRGSFLEFFDSGEVSEEKHSGVLSSSANKVIQNSDFIGVDDLKGCFFEFVDGNNKGKTYYITKHDSTTGTIQIRGRARYEIDHIGNAFTLILFQKLRFDGIGNDSDSNDFTIAILNDTTAGNESIVWGVDSVEIHIEEGVTTWNDLIAGTPSGTAWATLSVIDPASIVLADTLDPTPISAYPDSVMKPGKSPDTYRIFKNAIVIRYCEKVTKIDSINMPFEYDDFTADTLMHGLRYYGEIQTDEETVAANEWRFAWQRALNTFKSKKSPRIGSKTRW